LCAFCYRDAPNGAQAATGRTPTVKIRAADDLIAPAVHDAIGQLPLRPEDHAAATLAQTYATAIDDADNPQHALDQLGPKLLAVLEQLGATPKARAQIMKGTSSGENPGKLAALRAARP
jgi:hypothetical protein